MDSQKRDESRDRRREEALARRMGDALDQLAPGHTEECPDAELIAAYHEQSLQPDEIARCKGHFAICGRCRKILAVLAASVEAPLAEQEVAHLGVFIAATRAPARAGARPVDTARPNRLAWRMRWLSPALGVAAVLAVWFAMRPPWRTADQNSSTTLIAQAPKSEPLPSLESRTTEQSSEAATKKSAETDAEVLKDRLGAKAQSPNPATDALAKNRLDGGRALGGVASNPGVAENTLRDEKKEKTETNSALAGGPFSAALPAPGARSTEQLPQAQAQAQLQVPQESPKVSAPPPASNQSAVVTEAAPSVSTTGSAAGAVAGNAPAREKRTLAAPRGAGDKTAASADGNQTMVGRNFKSLSQTGTPVGDATLLMSPSGSKFWRVGKGGNIAYSMDGGSTWILQTSPLKEDWLAGAAVSDTICWLAGRNGAIARTTDGVSWEKIAPPPLAAEPSGKSPDWLGISAASAQTATITASDQRRYVTQDGGKTWRSIP
jgi:hypothetical protein